MTLRRILIAAPILLVAAVVAAGAGWWFFVRETNSLATSAPAIPTDLVGSRTAATQASGTPASASTPGDALTFAILQDRSVASYFVDEKLAELPLPSTAKGSTSDVTGQFRLTPSGELDPAQPATFTVDLTTLKSDRDMRDRRVQSQGLQTQTFPKATFTATKVSGWDVNAPAGQEQTLQLTGMLDLHGVQKEVTWDVKARHDGNVITALATTKFNFGDFNIPDPEHRRVRLRAGRRHAAGAGRRSVGVEEMTTRVGSKSLAGAGRYDARLRRGVARPLLPRDGFAPERRPERAGLRAPARPAAGKRAHLRTGRQSSASPTG